MAEHGNNEVSSDIELKHLVRDLTEADGERIEPPADIWAGIEAAVTTTGSAATAPVVDLASRRRPLSAAVLSTAAALLVVAGVLAIVRRGGNAEVLATAELAYNADQFDALGASAVAGAQLIDDDGTFRVELVDTSLPTPNDSEADLELWLIAPDADGNVAELVSLGTFNPDNPGTFAVPADHDPDVFYVVDISVEPRDGDKTHSGRSILRGALSKT
ncbi:MAG: hypothetical protein ACI8Y4_001029 [Candidatus Poriferisodalaceae bacterium]|jgi:hypothetical protein